MLNHVRVRHASALTLFLGLLALPAILRGDDQTHPAPTAKHPAPRDYLLLRLVGDRTDVRYTPGSLDRSANLQTRLELAARAFEKWADLELAGHVFVLDREKWQEAGYAVPYGVPVRVAASSLAVPAEGDDGTVVLWSALLGGMLPTIQGLPLRGTPEQLGTMLVADVVAQLLYCEAFLDVLGLKANQPWVHGVATHLASLSLVQRLEPGRIPQLDVLYAALSRPHDPGTLSVRDYSEQLDLAEWLWYQAQFHHGAKTILAKKNGKDAIKMLRKMAKNNGGILRDEDLLRRFEGLRDWHRQTFTTVSRR